MMPNESFALVNARRRLEKDIDRNLLLLHSQADAIENARFNQVTIASSQNVLRIGHPEFVDPGYREVTVHWMWVLGLVVLYVFDFLLLSAPAEYLTLKNFPGHPNIALLSRFFVPFAALCIELFVAEKLRNSRVSQLDGGSLLPVLAWGGFGLLWAVCIAAWVYFAQRATDLLSGTTWALVGFKCIVAFMALLVHSVITFSGEPLSEAKAYVGFRFRWRVLKRVMRRENRREYENRVIATATFTRYARCIESRNREFPCVLQVTPGPFSRNVRNFIHETFPGTLLPCERMAYPSTSQLELMNSNSSFSAAERTG